jgi:AraC family transcriptional regulator
MLKALDGVMFEQGSGGRPEVLIATKSAGEYGIGIVQFRFAGGAFSKGAALHHLLMFNLGNPVLITCQIGQKLLDHVAPTGNVTICPADTEFSAESSYSVDTLLLAIPTDLFACLSAEHSKPMASPAEKLSGCDDVLFAIARELADEAASGFSSGPHYWTEVTDTLLSCLFENHHSVRLPGGRGVLNAETLTRINAYVGEHLAEPIDVDMLADVAAKGRSHFPRIFRRSVGMSPYQYLVRLRLKYALRMISEGEMTLTEVAAATGFTDQSHLCRWTKRVYGTSPAQLAVEVSMPS